MVALGCALLAANAVATPPQKWHYSYDGPGGIDTTLCGFEVTITILVGEVDQTIYLDASGNLITKVVEHGLQQDAFSANGKTLTGRSYRYTDTTYYDQGLPTYTVAEGVLEKVPLPGGSLFISAGRVNPFTGFALEPDHGTIQNLEGFCAALAP
jgi:hypothetical protein